MSSDADLIAGLIAKDRAALDALMDRYDRLVRFTILRLAKTVCLQDPHFMDSVAQAAWMGLIRSVQENPNSPPRSVKAYLVQVTHHQCISSLRALARTHLTDGQALSETTLEAEQLSPDEISETLDILAALRSHLSQLPDTYRTMLAEIELIVERRWTDAAEKLGWSESTLRSRWGQMLELLRKAMGEK